jgi:NADPH2:quinone reductase
VRAALVHEWRSPPAFADVPEVTRRQGETLVEVQAATVSHLDVTVASGEFSVSPPLPYVPGVEGAGIVVESDTLPRGQQVIVRDGRLGLTCDGAWRERASVADEDLLPLDIALPPSIAATFFTPVTTAHVALFDVGRLQAGQTVLVSGAAGAVGSVAVQLARSAGCQVIAVQSRASRPATPPPGVTVVTLDDDAARTRLRASRPADLLVDTIGGEGLGDRLSWVRPGGRVACVGYTAGTAAVLDLPNWLYADVALSPVNMIARRERAEQVARQLLPDIASGAIRLQVEEFPIERVAEAWQKVNSRTASGRAVIRF